MKGIKGERKCYGIKSPFHSTFVRHGIKYQGARSTNGYQKSPWYIYGTDAGADQPDITLMLGELMSLGWKVRNDLDGKLMSFPSTGNKGEAATYECYDMETEVGKTLHTLNIVVMSYHNKPSKNYISVNEITFPPM
jgi:hypothetical protein